MFFLKKFVLGIRKEIKRIRWISMEEVWPKTFKVILFCFVFFIFFLVIDSLIAWFLQWIDVIKPETESTESVIRISYGR